MTLTEFLLARITETQAAADGFHSRECYLFVPDHMQADPPECDCGVPARVLADCEAKRRIVEHFTWDDLGDEVSDPEGVLARLATVDADHPDYREEWKP